MKQTIVISAIIFGLLSSNCRTQSEQATQIRSTESIQEDSPELDCMPTAFYYPHGNCQTYFSPGTFAETTYLYNSTKPNGKIIDTLKFNTSVNILAEDTGFYLICTPEGKSGYVDKTNLYLHLHWGIKSFTYVFGLSGYVPQTIGCYPIKIKIVKSHYNKIVNEFSHDILNWRYEIKPVYSALKNLEFLFQIRIIAMLNKEFRVNSLSLTMATKLCA